MGSFFTNLHVRCERTADPVAKIKSLGLGPTYISDIENGWLSIFPLKTEEQNPDEIIKVCARVSQIFCSPALAFLVHDSDIFMYFLARGGELVDFYNSDCGYFDENESHEPEGGNPELILPLCQPGTKETVLRRLLHEHLYGAKNDSRDELITADDIAFALSELLGIPDWRVPLGFDYIEDGEAQECPLTEIVTAADILPIIPNKEGFVQCPGCSYHFSVRNTDSFDGKKHKSCGQRLAIAALVQASTSLNADLAPHLLTSA